MKHDFLAGVAITAIMSGAAFAADIPLKAPGYAPEPIYSWTGCYMVVTLAVRGARIRR